MKNTGKVFETAFKNSVPNDIWYHRLPDPAEVFSTVKQGLKFVLSNPCDIFLYNPHNGVLYALELKSTEETSLTYWREDFVEDGKKNNFMIRDNQIKGLKKISEYGIICGFVINFRFTNHTYFISIDDFLNATNTSSKKSINEADVIRNNGVLIEQKLLRKNYKYNIEKFLCDVK